MREWGEREREGGWGGIFFIVIIILKMSTETDGVAMWWAAACEKGAAVGESGEESGVAEQITVSLKSVGHRYRPHHLVS